MTDEPNLELCFEQDLARVALARANSYTREDWSPVITKECATPEDLEHEIARLHGELDAILEAGRARFAGQPPPAAAPRPAEPAPDLSGLRIDAELRVRDVMTQDVQSIGRNDPVAIADGLMRAGRFRHVVVLDDDGRVEGVVSQRDLFFGALSWAMGHGQNAHERALEATSAKEVMRSPAETVDPDAPLAEAATTMAARKLGCLPVVRGDQLVGIITEGDFLALLTG